MKKASFYELALSTLKSDITEKHSYKEIKAMFSKLEVPLFQTFYPNLNSHFKSLYRIRRVKDFKEDRNLS